MIIREIRNVQINFLSRVTLTYFANVGITSKRSIFEKRKTLTVLGLNFSKKIKMVE